MSTSTTFSRNDALNTVQRFRRKIGRFEREDAQTLVQQFRNQVSHRKITCKCGEVYAKNYEKMHFNGQRHCLWEEFNCPEDLREFNKYNRMRFCVVVSNTFLTGENRDKFLEEHEVEYFEM